MDSAMSDGLQLRIERLKTPIGEMIVITDDDGNLRTTDWTDHEVRMNQFIEIHYGTAGLKVEPARKQTDVARAIDRYFDGKLDAIDAIPVKTGGTRLSAARPERNSPKVRSHERSPW